MNKLFTREPFVGLTRMIRKGTLAERKYIEHILKHSSVKQYFLNSVKYSPVSKSNESACDEETVKNEEPVTQRWNYTTTVHHGLYCLCEKGCDECEDKTPVPFIDLPMSTAVDVYETALVEPCRSGSPDLCLLYLQHGALPVHLYVGRHSINYISELKCQPLNVVLNGINQTMISHGQKHAHFGDVTDLALCEHVIGELSRHFLCLRYLLRADPFLRFDVKELFGDYDASLETDSDDTKVVLHTTLDRRLRDRFLPACLIERVPSLQRQCRFVIRCAVRRKHKIFKGVFTTKRLDIPTHLLHFLELTVD